jgi:hypothetical protein
MIRGLSTISPEAILTQLERIVTSSTFRQSERMVRFLRFVVTHAVEQRQEPLKEYAIGLALLGLIDELPVMLENVRASGASRPRSVITSAFEFISENRQIASVREFMRSLPESLSR